MSNIYKEEDTIYNFPHNTVAVADDAEHLVRARCCLLGTYSIYIFIFIMGNICRYRCFMIIGGDAMNDDMVVFPAHDSNIISRNPE